MAEKTIRVNSEIEAGFCVKNSVRNLEFVADQPKEQGGTNEGPTPVEYLLGSLGSCICLTIRLVADKMGLEVESASVKVEGDIDHEGMVNPQKVRPGVGKIRMLVDLKGNLSKKEKEKITQRTERVCPVSDTLKNPVNVSFQIKE